jgi:hypothetical protein
MSVHDVGLASGESGAKPDDRDGVTIRARPVADPHNSRVHARRQQRERLRRGEQAHLEARGVAALRQHADMTNRAARREAEDESDPPNRLDCLRRWPCRPWPRRRRL